MKLYIVQNYDYEENGSYITVATSKEEALKIANKYIDKRLEDKANIPPEGIGTEEENDSNFINREEGRLELEDICGVEIYETEPNNPLDFWLGGRVLN